MRACVLTSLPIILDGGLGSGGFLPALKAQLPVVQLHLSQVLLNVDRRLSGVATGWKLLGPVVLI